MFKRLKDSLRSSTHRTRRRQSRPPVLNLESLEDRRMLATFTVTNNVDGPVAAAGDLPGSLRQAIFDANTSPSNDTIEFDPLFFTGGGNSLIRLTAGELEIVDDVVVFGPGQSLLTLDAGGGDDGVVGNGDGHRIFRIDDGTNNPIDVELSGMTITGGDVSLLDLDGNGGAIHNRENLVVRQSRIQSNHARNGGGVWSNSNFAIRGSTLSGNTASLRGGGIFNYYFGTATVTDSTITDNNASYGGGVSNSNVANVIGSSLGGNDAQRGGGVDNSGTMFVMNSSLSDNTARLEGGGIFSRVGSRTTITKSNLSGNSADIGGGIFNSSIANVNVVSSTISGNSANGGGIFNDGRADVTSSTISGNTSRFGGGIYNTRSGTTNVIASTLTGNSGSSFGGGITSFGTANVTGSIVAGNTAGANPNIRGSLDINSHNLIDVDPQLGPLEFNGGPTKTHALLPGSPAIDAGSNALAMDVDGNPLAGDQRDFYRLIDGNNDGTATVDIGAVEFFSSSPIVTTVVRDRGGVLEHPDLLTAFSASFDVDVNVSAGDLVIRNDTLGGAVVETSVVTLTYDAATHTATWNFGSLALEPAFYSFELSTDIVSVDGGFSLDGDFDGNPGGTFAESVYVALPGDANLDGQVDVLNDAFALVENLGRTGGATWAQGDFNGDGNVDVLIDAFILVSRLGQSVVPPAPALATSAAGQTSKSSSVDPVSTQSAVLLGVEESLLDEQESDSPAVHSISSSARLSLAGSQNLDAAFESSNLLDEDLF